MSANQHKQHDFSGKVFLSSTKQTTFYALRWLLLSFLISICIGSASAGFLISLEWVTSFREAHLWIIFFLPVVGFLISWIYGKYGGNADQGNNLIIDTIHEGGDKIPFRMAPLVYGGTILTHLFGGSAGREGTALQMAGALADQFSRPMRLSPEERSILLIAAVAGGFGSVFGTPLAGAVFALEFYFIGRMRYHALFPALLTAVFSDQVARMWNAHHTHYHIDVVPLQTWQGIGWALVAGLLFALCAATFSKAMKGMSVFWKNKIAYAPMRTFMGGMLVVLGVYLLGTSKYIGLGVPTIVSAFEQQQQPYDFALKLLFTVVTLSAGFKGGEVTPLFFIGATLGNALSFFIPLPTAMLAGMGFVAVFAGATNTPIACTLMGIELFGAEGAVYIAIACFTAYLFSGNTSIYRKQRIGEPKNGNTSFQDKTISDVD